MPRRAARALAGIALLAGGGTAGYLAGTHLAPGRVGRHGGSAPDSRFRNSPAEPLVLLL